VRAAQVRIWVDGDQDYDGGGERDQREAALEEERLVLVEPEIEPDERAERGEAGDVEQ
jgi:hypothetical protein